ncbi:SDR family oxidoreductase [Chishuiella sp.]|uniref:SDR family oxidoreductase n=1 Tax=Chishuiella sp. TaxID=1969467 RepID=UPI0028A6A3D7|nr:SDR family NAD(P)-dependent oxidoreductase [Chishuiella sp.]
MNLTNKTILITGGTSGIGLEATRQFLKLGNKVIVTGRNKSKLNDLKKMFPQVIIFQSDVSKEEDAIQLYNDIKELGGIDILYNNAGVGINQLNLGSENKKHLEGAIYEMDVNYFGIIRLNNLFIEMLKSRSESAIINTTSILSIVPSVSEATYSASKTALSFYTKTLRSHLQSINSSVKIFELLPPLVDTDMVKDRTDKKISTQQLVESLIKGMEQNNYTIRVGASKIIYTLNRIMPNKAYNLINSEKELIKLNNNH